MEQKAEFQIAEIGEYTFRVDTRFRVPPQRKGYENLWDILELLRGVDWVDNGYRHSCTLVIGRMFSMPEMRAKIEAAILAWIEEGKAGLLAYLLLRARAALREHETAKAQLFHASLPLCLAMGVVLYWKG